MSKTIAKFLFYAVAVVLLTWTGSLTVSFLTMALPNAFWLVPLLGLVVFDFGMIAWLFVFLYHAQGSIQRAVAVVMTLFDFLGVGLMVIAEILLDGQQLAEAPALLGTAAIWGIGIWTVANVLAVIVFHLGDPAAQDAMAIQNEKDTLMALARKNLAERRQGQAAELSEAIGAKLFSDLLSQLAADRDNNGIPDVVQSGPIVPTPGDGRLTAAEVMAWLQANPDALKLALPSDAVRHATTVSANGHAPEQGGASGSRPR